MFFCYHVLHAPTEDVHVDVRVLMYMYVQYVCDMDKNGTWFVEGAL